MARTGAKPERREVHQPLPPTTTEQQDVTLAGQRRINLIWEYTQAGIALMVVLTCMVIFVLQAVTGEPAEFPSVLGNMTFSILAFYLARTNHQAIGGIGAKKTDTQPYEGR